MASVKDFSVEDKLKNLLQLQKIDSKLDEIQVLKGSESTINKYKPIIWLEDMDYQTNNQSTLHEFIYHFPDYKVLSTRGRNVILGSTFNS